ncbi:MAG: hypothetical protein ABJE10_01645 [bacterium]
MSYIRRAPVVIASVLIAGQLQAQGYKVIANASVTDVAVSRAHLTRLFLKQDSKLPSGAPVVVVDLNSASPVRQAFSKAVLGRDVGSVKTFWQQQIFAGRASPPIEKATDAEIAAYVAATPGAIGYVSIATVGAGIKTLEVTP